MPARLSKTCVASVPSVVPSNVRFYNWLFPLCNAAIFSVLLFQGYGFYLNVKCSDHFFSWTQFGLELPQAIILAVVFIARIVAEVTNQSRNWFYLAWPEDKDNIRKEFVDLTFDKGPVDVDVLTDAVKTVGTEVFGGEPLLPSKTKDI